MTLKCNPLLSGKTRRTVWTPARVEGELLALRSLEFFQYHNHSIDQGSLRLQGRISAKQPESGKHLSMEVRLEYPVEYPWEIPTVFDQEMHFRPSANGHQFSNYVLCLSFPAREEFTVGSEALSAEVLGASLIWLDKRSIFERTTKWPGEAEEHGWARPFCKLLIEEANLTKSDSMKSWTDWIIAGLVMPRFDAGCPCRSGRYFCQCHRRMAMLVCQFVFWREEEQKLNDQRSALEAA